MPSEREILHLPPPRFCMKSKCNTHPPLPAHTSVCKPQKLLLGEEFIQGTPLHLPHAEVPCGVSHFSSSHWVGVQEPSADGEGGGRRSWATPAARGDSSEHLSDLGLAPLAGTRTVRGSLQGRVYACERGRAPLASGVVGAQGIPSILSRVGEFDNLGEVPAQPLSDGFVCGPRRSVSQFACPVTVVAATLGP